MRHTPDGTHVTNFSVALDRRWNNSDGSQGEEVICMRCTAWRKTAEVVNQYLAKGRQVLVEGRLRPDENSNPRVFTRSDGSAGSSYEVTVETIKFLGRPPSSRRTLDGPGQGSQAGFRRERE